MMGIYGTQEYCRSAHVASTHWVDLSVRYIWAIFAVLLLIIPASAQDEPGPCDPPTDKKIVKLL
jgi:hypothetical protein